MLIIVCRPGCVFNIFLEKFLYLLLAFMGLCNLFSYLDCINSIKMLLPFIQTNNAFVTKKKISNR